MALDLKQEFADLGAKVQERVQGSLTSGASRRDQLLAATLLPFFIVTVFAVALVVKDVIADLVPGDVTGLAAVNFLLGTALLISSIALSFGWVKTGGFGVFSS